MSKLKKEQKNNALELKISKGCLFHAVNLTNVLVFFTAPRPGYGLTSPKSATLPATNRAGSYDPYVSSPNRK